MQIIGFNLTKVSGERQEGFSGDLDLKQNLNIDEIKEDEIKISKQKVLNVTFTFGLDYTENKLGNIEIKGKIVILPEKDEMKIVLKKWETKELPDAFKLFVFNFILSKCNIKALQLEDELNLPPHVQLPKLSSKPNETPKESTSTETPKEPTSTETSKESTSTETPEEKKE